MCNDMNFCDYQIRGKKYVRKSMLGAIELR